MGWVPGVCMVVRPMGWVLVSLFGCETRGLGTSELDCVEDPEISCENKVRENFLALKQALLFPDPNIFSHGNAWVSRPSGFWTVNELLGLRKKRVTRYPARGSQKEKSNQVPSARVSERKSQPGTRRAGTTANRQRQAQKILPQCQGTGRI